GGTKYATDYTDFTDENLRKRRRGRERANGQDDKRRKEKEQNGKSRREHPGSRKRKPRSWRATPRREPKKGSWSCPISPLSDLLIREIRVIRGHFPAGGFSVATFARRSCFDALGVSVRSSRATRRAAGVVTAAP